MDDNKKVKVKNRSGNGTVGYSIPDMGNLTRSYSDGEEKIITYEEIRKLSYVPGGQEMLENYFIIEDREVLDELNFVPEPEYFYNKEDIIKLMQAGSLDEFLDCLDFAPEGVKESIKELAIELPLNDVAKRDAIQEKLNFNVSKAIEIKKASEEDIQEAVVKPVAQRRAATVSSGIQTGSNTANTSGRRVIIKE